MIDLLIAFGAGVVCCLVFLMFVFSVIVLASESGHKRGYQPKEGLRKDPPRTGSAVHLEQHDEHWKEREE